MGELQEKTKIVRGRMRAIAPCYVNENLYKPGDEFDYEGPPSRAFHNVKSDPPPIGYATYEAEIDAAIMKQPSEVIEKIR